MTCSLHYIKSSSVEMVTAISPSCGTYIIFRVLQDYEDFFLSKETNTVFAFLGLHSQPSVKVRDAFNSSY